MTEEHGDHRGEQPVERALPVVPYETVPLVRWSGPWPAEDPDADYKQQVADHRLIDPMETVRGLATALDIPVGAVVHHILARWATAGSSGLLEIGSETVSLMRRIVDEAEARGTDSARLDAYSSLAGIISWLNHPLEHPEVYDLEPSPKSTPDNP